MYRSCWAVTCAFIGYDNWRKNINVSDIEQAQQKLNQEQIKIQKISDLKNDDLFEIDDNLAIPLFVGLILSILG